MTPPLNSLSEQTGRVQKLNVEMVLLCDNNSEVGLAAYKKYSLATVSGIVLSDNIPRIWSSHPVSQQTSAYSPTFPVEVNHMNQIFTIAAIQHLKLRFSVEFVTPYSASILLAGTRLLQATVHSNIKKCSDIASLLDTHAVFLHDSLCTWRPTHCLDIFVYFGQKSSIFVGIPMLTEGPPQQQELGLHWKKMDIRSMQLPLQGRNITHHCPDLAAALLHRTSFSSHEFAELGVEDLCYRDYIVSGQDGHYFVPDTASRVEIKHYTTETHNVAPNMPECVCFAHLTCDQDEHANTTMVILVYDLLLKNDDTLDTKQRYAYLRSMQDQLADVKIGDACMRVQWAGDLSIYDTLESLTLPHAHDKIVIYGSALHPYDQYLID